MDRWEYLAPVASARERAQHVYMLELAQQLVHRELHGLAHEALDTKAVITPVNPRDRAMIADIVQRGWGDETVLHQHIRWRFHIEGVPAQAHTMSNNFLKDYITTGGG